MLPSSRAGNYKRKNSSPGQQYLWSSYPVAMAQSHSNRAWVLILLAMLGIFVFFILGNIPLSAPSHALRGGSGAGSMSHGTVVSLSNPNLKVDLDRVLSNVPSGLDIGIVADLDKRSRDESSKKPLFFSFFRKGKLRFVRNDADPTSKNQFSVSWEEAQRFETKMNEGGRGFELSELKWFNGNLYSFDDRTGIMFRLENFQTAAMLPLAAYPEQIVMERSGASGKGQKHEWATVKDGELYIGSIGKEFTNENGEVVSDANFWVAVMDKTGKVRHEDWTTNYKALRKALDCDYPGYLIHESIEWSHIHRKWFVLPRRVSNESYDDMKDEKRGSNVMIIANEFFTEVQFRYIGGQDRLQSTKGFSSFKFLPKSDDQLILAIKSVENEEEQTQGAFITVFDIEGNVLMEDSEVDGGYKYEGLEFLQAWTPRESP